MPSNTVYSPTRESDFESIKLNFNGQGTSAAIVAAGTVNLDVTMADDHLLTGVWFWTAGGLAGDSVRFQVVDTTGAFSGTPGTVLKEFVNSWLVPANANVHFDVKYPAKVLTGMTLRLVYTGIAQSAGTVGINYKLHKVLV